MRTGALLVLVFPSFLSFAASELWRNPPEDHRTSFAIAPTPKGWTYRDNHTAVLTRAGAPPIHGLPDFGVVFAVLPEYLPVSPVKATEKAPI